MRIHTSLEEDEIRSALEDAKASGRIASHLYFDRFDVHRSTTHTYAYEVHIGTDYKTPGDGRRAPMHSPYEFARYAATYDEWGWFLVELFDRDPSAKVAGVYRDHQHFHERTRYAFA